MEPGQRGSERASSQKAVAAISGHCRDREPPIRSAAGVAAGIISTVQNEEICDRRNMIDRHTIGVATLARSHEVGDSQDEGTQ
jgi:hypothetical protein